MMYWVIHLTETDSGITLWPCKSKKDVDDYVVLANLHREDYAIIKGDILKDFSHITF